MWKVNLKVLEENISKWIRIGKVDKVEFFKISIKVDFGWLKRKSIC